MKILIHSANFAPEPTGIGKYSGEMAEWLAAHPKPTIAVFAALFDKAMIASTAAKLIWKLAPSSASGRTTNMAKAAASSRKLNACRPSIMPTTTMQAAITARTVGTCAPASSV